MNLINLNENNERDVSLVITTNKLNELGQLPYSTDRDAEINRLALKVAGLTAESGVA